MTQKELAGEEITRNMLSRIENGAATPSLQTLLYLAERLGVPAGYLLSEKSENEGYYKKYSNYKNILASFKRGEWGICRDLCADCLSEMSDNELVYMFAYSSMQFGIENFTKGNLRLAVNAFEDAVEYASKTVFETSSMFSCMRSYRNIMVSISLTLDFELPEGKGDYECVSDICKFERLLFDGGTEHADEWKNPGYSYALNAKRMTEAGNYKSAMALCMHVYGDETLPKPIIYLILEDYEKCCRETEDYKDAYEISKNRTDLFEKMLSGE